MRDYLRCEVRETVMDFLRTDMPEALVRTRQKLEGELRRESEISPLANRSG